MTGYIINVLCLTLPRWKLNSATEESNFKFGALCRSFVSPHILGGPTAPEKSRLDILIKRIIRSNAVSVFMILGGFLMQLIISKLS